MPPTEDPLVEVAAEDPRIRVRTVYATADNFVGEVLYPVSRTFLRRSAMERLSRVQDRLEAQGLGLLVYDGYRPWSVTKRMWDVIGDPDFVADPSKGSRHNRGMAVDCGLVDAEGRPLPMPTAFDAFVPEARADALLASAELTRNREILVSTMEAEGFSVLSSEWWHFDAEGWEQRGCSTCRWPTCRVERTRRVRRTSRDPDIPVRGALTAQRRRPRPGSRQGPWAREGRPGIGFQVGAAGASTERDAGVPGPSPRFAPGSARKPPEEASCLIPPRRRGTWQPPCYLVPRPPRPATADPHDAPP